MSRKVKKRQEFLDIFDFDTNIMRHGNMFWGVLPGQAVTATSRLLGHVVGEGPAGRRVTIATLSHSETCR